MSGQGKSPKRGKSKKEAAPVVSMEPIAVSIRTAAKLCDVSETTVKDWIYKHGLVTYQNTNDPSKKSKILRILPSDLKAFFNSHFRRYGPPPAQEEKQ